jgi:hypothetical protein
MLDVLIACEKGTAGTFKHGGHGDHGETLRKIGAFNTD